MTETSYTCRAMSVCRSVRRCDTKCCDMLQSVAAYTKPKKITPTRAGGVMSHMNNAWHIWMSVCVWLCMCACMKPKKKPPSEHIENRRFGLFRNTSVRDTSDIPDAISGDSSGNRKEARDSSGKEELWSQSELYWIWDWFMSHIAYGTESCRTWECVVLHMGLSHVTYEGVKSRIYEAWWWVMLYMHVASWREGLCSRTESYWTWNSSCCTWD